MVSAYPRILMWPLLAAVFFAPAAATRCSDARAEMTAQCETGGVPIGDHDAYSGFTAFCGNTVCTSALRNVRFQCPSRCSADGTPLRDDEDQARVDAGVGLAFCGSCIKWKSQVTAKCDADLALSGAPAVAAYCENAECGFALQQMFAFCAPSNTDRENINEESRVICDGVSDCTIALTPSAPEHYAAAEGALMHCAPKTAPPAQLLRENRFMMNQWMDDLGAILKGSVKANRKLAEVSNPLVVNCPPTPTDAAPCPEDGDDDCHCPEGCDNCGNIEMKNFFDMTRCSTDDDTEVRAERCTMCNANGIDEESCWEDTIKEDACATDGGYTVPSPTPSRTPSRV
ncbi:hypothetical protein T484DRAFT_3200612 [Baffinella frigidus]|nr:hypothetical protein T484DRAFT_3200612 [Cryptophyta sp. CCMP2293]